MLIIAFLLVVTSLLSISITSSALLPYDISTPDGEGGGESFEVLVTVAGVKGNCGQEVKITVAYTSQKHLNYVKEMKDHLKNKEQIQYHPKDISLNFQKDNLHQANTLMSVLKSLAASQIARL
jgi:hypothetical protein